MAVPVTRKLSLFGDYDNDDDDHDNEEDDIHRYCAGVKLSDCSLHKKIWWDAKIKQQERTITSPFTPVNAVIARQKDPITGPTIADHPLKESLRIFAFAFKLTTLQFCKTMHSVQPFCLCIAHLLAKATKTHSEFIYLHDCIDLDMNICIAD